MVTMKSDRSHDNSNRAAKPRRRPGRAGGSGLAGVREHAERILFARYSPTALLVNDALEVLTTSGAAAPWLQVPAGHRRASLLDVVPDELLPELAAAIEHARSGRPARSEGVVVTLDGKQRTVNLDVTTLHGRRPYRQRYFLVVLENDPDASERKRLARAAQEALALRDEFFAVAAHELRTPLTALRLHLQALEPVIGSLADAASAHKLERATRQTDRLSVLIDTLVDVVRLSSGQFPLQREDTDLAEVTREVVARSREHAERVSCQLVVDASRPAIGCWDRIRMDQIVTHLLSNAFRYAPGGPVELSVAPGERMVTLTVTDHGPGIPKDQWQRIFQRFGRGAGLRSFGGLGLGLYVTRQITEAHGGSIRLANQPGAGASFVVELPFQAPSP